MKPFDRMMVYIDGGEGSINALMYAIMTAREIGAELTVCYVVNTKAVRDLVKSHIFASFEGEDYMKDLKEDAARHLRHAERLADKKGLKICSIELEGAPHDVICRYIREKGIDLLVLGGVNDIRSRREEMLGEADRLLRTSPSAVLVVRDDDEAVWDRFEEF